MQIGIGLPNAIAGTTGDELVEWAREAERLDFSALGTIDRIVYDNYEPLTALAAAAAVTERIRLATTILLAPLRTNAALLAKQAATVDALSGGRLVLGLAVGARADDYEVSGVPMRERGQRIDAALTEMRRIWTGDGDGALARIGPKRTKGPTLIIGGTADASFRRAAEHAEGWILGGGAPEQFGEAAEQLRTAWRDAGREGEPRTMAIAYFALGASAEEDARRGLGGYYAFLGEHADAIVHGALKDGDAVRDRIAAFERAGCDELIMFPSASDPAQVGLLREAIDG
jgi:alkanesulfonate monooxygenase SsuD/methylene tetrahydromethanopterin reductase-like flavin-dependent oxidoreductase (luciferase family)